MFGVVFLTTLAILAVDGKTYDVRDGRHNITVGHRQGPYPHYTDHLIITDNPRMSSSFLRVKSYDICYPRKGLDTTRMFSITTFNVTDRMPEGQGGYAFVDKGGVNSGKLCLHLKTQRGNAYNFDVKIWGIFIN